jgi:ligand-binding sensor domain-containing protein
MRSICFTAIFLLACSAVVLAERLPIKIYTSADGLGSSASFNLVSDPRGFIWLCSRDGLVRFDGHRFITYRIGDENADPSVFNLLPTRSGQYWIDLNRGTDYRFVPRPDSALLQPRGPDTSGGDTRVSIDAVPLGDTPMARFEDAEGNLWAGDGEGIYLMKENAGVFSTQLFKLAVPEPDKPLTYVNFVSAERGGLWLGTDRGLVRRFTDGRMIHYSIKPQNGIDVVRFFAEDNDGRLWIAGPDGVVVLKTNAENTPSGSVTATVSPRAIGRDGIAALPETGNEAV